VQRLIAVNPNQLFMYWINHYVHSLKGQRAQEYFLCIGNYNSGKYDAAVFPLDFHSFGYIIGICFAVSKGRLGCFLNGKPQLLPDILVDNQCLRSGVGHCLYCHFTDFRVRNNSCSGVADIRGIGQDDFFFKSTHLVFLRGLFLWMLTLVC
jgi:hypothetical protein